MSPVSASFIPGITRSDDGNELLDTHRDTGTRRTIGGRPPGKPRSPLSILKPDREDIAWRSKNRKRMLVGSALSSRELRESVLRFDEEDVVEFQVDADPSEPSREQQKLARSAHRLE